MMAYETKPEHARGEQVSLLFAPAARLVTEGIAP
jgi:hypothetical protein